MAPLDRPFALTWQLSEVHGWGLVGVHTALCLIEEYNTHALLLEAPAMSTLRSQNVDKLARLVDGYLKINGISEKNAGKQLGLPGYDVLHALGNDFQLSDASRRWRGARNVGVVAFEETVFDDSVRSRAKSFDAVMVHSTYNLRLLEAEGVGNLRLSLQGVDPSEVGPGPGGHRFGDRFVVFSGGKLEFRKGQDLVLAAFQRFREKHSDALLVTAWHNHWPQTALSMAESKVVHRTPRIDGDRLCITEWALENGAPAESFVDLGLLRRDQIAPILRDCSVALFPNRCEGATNLVAMEAMACGVPTILSDNTGHQDLLSAGDVAYVLSHQRPVPDPHGGRRGWGESDVEEIVSLLEKVYKDRVEARRRAKLACDFILGQRTWRQFARAFVDGCAR